MSATATARLALWNHIFPDEPGYISLFSGLRDEGSKDLRNPHHMHFAWPDDAAKASAWLNQKSAEGREVYACAHLVTERQRKKEYAGPVKALYVDGDGAQFPDHLPAPTAIVESSPGRHQFYLQLDRAIDPQQAEDLNRRLAYAISADLSGWDLTQLLRPPDTPNRKYPDAPAVRLIYLDDALAYDPDELERILPPAPKSTSADGLTFGDDEPPVRLPPDALRWWTGEKHAKSRSDTLFGIAKDLYRAGATISAIATALANRDVALNFEGGPKYANRPDANERYLITARRAAVDVEREQAQAKAFAETIPQASASTDDDDSSCRMEVMRLQARIDQLEAEVAALRGHHSVTERVHNNPGLTPAQGQIATNVVAEVASKASTGQAQDGWALVRLDAIVKTAEAIDPETGELVSKRIVSKQTASRYIDLLADAGVWEVYEKPRFDGGSPITDKYIRLLGEPDETLEKLATIVLDRPKHGGSKPGHRRCKKHPNAGVNISRVTRCAECQEIIDEQHIEHVPAVPFQDGTVEESGSLVDVPIGVRMEPSEEDVARTAERRQKLRANPSRFQHETVGRSAQPAESLDDRIIAAVTGRPLDEKGIAVAIGQTPRIVEAVVHGLVRQRRLKRWSDGFYTPVRPSIGGD